MSQIDRNQSRAAQLQDYNDPWRVSDTCGDLRDTVCTLCGSYSYVGAVRERACVDAED